MNKINSLIFKCKNVCKNGKRFMKGLTEPVSLLNQYQGGIDVVRQSFVTYLIGLVNNPAL